MYKIIIIDSCIRYHLTTYLEVFNKKYYQCVFFKSSQCALKRLTDFENCDLVLMLDCIHDSCKIKLIHKIKNKFFLSKVILISNQLYQVKDVLPAYVNSIIPLPLKKQDLCMVRENFFC